MARNDKQDRIAKEREEISARVASFRATQERFAREREQYATTAWARAGRNERGE